MILGVVLAGGKSTRFGSDKALAELGGRTLLARAVDALSGLCELVVIAGRDHGPARVHSRLAARPRMGPLGGIAAGLHHALDEGFETVLTCGVDCAALPDDLLDLLSPAPAYLADQPVVGHWPASAAKDDRKYSRRQRAAFDAGLCRGDWCASREKRARTC